MKRTTLLTRGGGPVNAELADDLAARVLDRHRPRGRPSSTPSRSRNAASARRIGRCAPSSTLSATPSPSRAAQRSPSAPPFATQPSPSRMSSVSAAPSPGSAPGGRASRPRHARRRRARRAARRRAPSARASARTSPRRTRRWPVGIDSGSTSAADATSASIACWHGCDARRYPSVGQPWTRQSSSIAACLPGAVVLEPGRLRSALEVVLGRGGLVQQTPHGLELVGAMQMRRTRDRDLGVVEVRPRTHHRQRLDRLRRAAEERDELGIAARRDDRAVRHRDCVHVVPSLLVPASEADDGDSLHPRAA